MSDLGFMVTQYGMSNQSDKVVKEPKRYKSSLPEVDIRQSNELNQITQPFKKLYQKFQLTQNKTTRLDQTIKKQMQLVTDTYKIKLQHQKNINQLEEDEKVLNQNRTLSLKSRYSKCQTNRLNYLSQRVKKCQEHFEQLESTKEKNKLEDRQEKLEDSALKLTQYRSGMNNFMQKRSMDQLLHSQHASEAKGVIVKALERRSILDQKSHGYSTLMENKLNKSCDNAIQNHNRSIEQIIQKFATLNDSGGKYQNIKQDIYIKMHQHNIDTNGSLTLKINTNRKTRINVKQITIKSSQEQEEWKIERVNQKIKQLQQDQQKRVIRLQEKTDEPHSASVRSNYKDSSLEKVNSKQQEINQQKDRINDQIMSKVQGQLLKNNNYDNMLKDISAKTPFLKYQTMMIHNI